LLCACRGPAQTPESLALSPQCDLVRGAARPCQALLVPLHPIHSSAIASVQPSAVLGDYLAFHPVVSIPCSRLYSCRRDNAQPSLPRRPVALAHLPPFRLTHVPQGPCNPSCSPAALQPSRPSPSRPVALLASSAFSPSLPSYTIPASSRPTQNICKILAHRVHRHAPASGSLLRSICTGAAKGLQAHVAAPVIIVATLETKQQQTYLAHVARQRPPPLLTSFSFTFHVTRVHVKLAR
jgi:hypothetical protein